MLPEFYRFSSIYETLILISQDHPEVLLPDTELYTLFGNFPSCIWDGGRYSVGGSVPKSVIKEIIEFYNIKLNVSLTFTFTNPLLEKKHCDDLYSNIIAECGNNGHNSILITNPILEEYLRNNYKNYKYCRSILAAEEKPYSLTSDYGTYDISVLRRSNNNNWSYLRTIPLEDRPHIELLCNDPCPDDCPRIYTHYKDFGKAQLELDDKAPNLNCTMRKIQGTFVYNYTKTKVKSYISREMIDNIYLPNGFCKFKCAGRMSTIAAMLNIINYLIKPEYKDDLWHYMYAACGMT